MKIEEALQTKQKTYKKCLNTNPNKHNIDIYKRKRIGPFHMKTK